MQPTSKQLGTHKHDQHRLQNIACLLTGALWQMDAVCDAEAEERPIQHPLLDRVRQCSATPDLAADFFTKILYPFGEWRMCSKAIQHAYVAGTVAEMEAYHQAQSPKSVLQSLSGENALGRIPLPKLSVHC